MKHGHVTGRKRERKPRQPWWAAQEEVNIQAVEAAWKVKQNHAAKEKGHGTR